ncbi:hypothetical protein BLOT_010959 [Blomia tropicalis]|nr:hypothetical protein BLOT_010959 [Blomia tropicalis]
MRMVRMWSPIRIVAAICRSCVGAISVANWIIGTIILVFFIWTLNTSGNFHLMGKGRSIITITELIFGLLVSVQGLIGLFGACQRQEWLLKLFLFLTIMTVSIEVGTFVSLRVTEVKVADLVEQSWTEANLNTRNYIQREFQCCGLTGLSEFASKLDPIDDSCYPPRSENIVPNMGRQPFRIGCKPKMIDWINKSRNRFISLSDISDCRWLRVVKLLKDNDIWSNDGQKFDIEPML